MASRVADAGDWIELQSACGHAGHDHSVVTALRTPSLGDSDYRSGEAQAGDTRDGEPPALLDDGGDQAFALGVTDAGTRVRRQQRVGMGSNDWAGRSAKLRL